jgi:rRNA maturation endonuclease Nob1
MGGRRARRVTVLRLAVLLLTYDSNPMSRGGADKYRYLYQCENGHKRYYPQHQPRRPKCEKCGSRMDFVSDPDKP